MTVLKKKTNKTLANLVTSCLCGQPIIIQETLKDPATLKAGSTGSNRPGKPVPNLL